MSYFESSNPLSQTSLLTSAIAPLNTDLTLCPTNDLQDSQMAVSALGCASVSDLSSAIASQTFTVTSTADTIDANDGVLTLREAIAQANRTAGANQRSCRLFNPRSLENLALISM